ncbi:unnamed protein product [Caretta caretta]
MMVLTYFENLNILKKNCFEKNYTKLFYCIHIPGIYWDVNEDGQVKFTPVQRTNTRPIHHPLYIKARAASSTHKLRKSHQTGWSPPTEVVLLLRRT